MAYQWNVSLIIPPERFGKLYGEKFNYKRPVSVERAPFIDSDRSSQVSYLRWIADQTNVAKGDKDHIAEVVDVFSHLPFDMSCVRCGNEKAVKIVLAYQTDYTGFRDVSYTNFPFYCGGCGDYAGAHTLPFALNFDDPFVKQTNTRLGRRKLLADLKSMLYLGFEGGPREHLDTKEIAARAREMRRQGRFVMHIDNKKAKELVNMLHYLKEKKIQKSSGGLLFDAEPPESFIPEDYKKRDIFIVERARKERSFFK